MAERRVGCGTWLLGAVVIGSLAVIGCCGCGGVGVLVAPNLMVGMVTWFFLEDAPLGPPPARVDPAAKDLLLYAACVDLLADRPGRVDPAILVDVLAQDEPNLAHLAITSAGDDVGMTMSFGNADEGYVNVAGHGAFVIEHGWFTDLRIDQLTISGWELGPYVAGQQLAENANQNLADTRSKDPQFAATLDAFDRIGVAGGQLEVVPRPGAVQALGLCATP